MHTQSFPSVKTVPGGGSWGDVSMQPACADLPGFEIHGATIRTMSVKVSHELPGSQEGLVLALLLPAHCPKDSLDEQPTSNE